MKKLILKIIIFCIPLILVLLPPSLYLFKIKENFFDIENFIENSNSDKYLIGYTYNEKNYKFLKWKIINTKPKYEIWSLGSSRAMQFRSEMFDSSFYNAGFTIGRINEFLPFMKSIDHSKYPDVLIVTLDTWMFNTKHDKVEDVVDETKWINSFKMYPNFSIFKSAWVDLIKDRFSQNKTYNTEGYFRVGYNALYKNSGFRNDGSFYYGEQIKKLLANDSTCLDYQFKSTFTKIDKGIDRFEYGINPNPKAFEELRKFIHFCKSNKINVVLVLPPFAETICNKMLSSSNYTYIDKISKKCDSIAKENDVEFYDFTSPKMISSGDNEFIDGFHGGEKVYIKMLITILEKESNLNKKTSIDRLKNNLNNSISDYQVYKEKVN
jgi:hypothetical protein